MKKILFLLLLCALIFPSCEKEDQCKIFGAWNYQADQTKFVYCFTKDSMILVFDGAQKGRLAIPIVISENKIAVFDAKCQVWQYGNDCDTLKIQNDLGTQVLWR